MRELGLRAALGRFVCGAGAALALVGPVWVGRLLPQLGHQRGGLAQAVVQPSIRDLVRQHVGDVGWLRALALQRVSAFGPSQSSSAPRAHAAQ